MVCFIGGETLGPCNAAAAAGDRDDPQARRDGGGSHPTRAAAIGTTGRRIRHIPDGQVARVSAWARCARRFAAIGSACLVYGLAMVGLSVLIVITLGLLSPLIAAVWLLAATLGPSIPGQAEAGIVKGQGS
jgi:hypothetical protein